MTADEEDGRGGSEADGDGSGADFDDRARDPPLSCSASSQPIALPMEAGTTATEISLSAPPSNEPSRRQEQLPDDDDDDGCPNPRQPSLSLILPCPDGTFPYLTPHMLRKCFPVRRFPHLVVGIAVRDSCVVPVAAAAATTSSQTTEETKGAARNGGPSDKKQQRPANKGYTFATASTDEGGSRTLVDPWLRHYRRIVVPTFDLWGDDDENEEETVRKLDDRPPSTSGNGPKAKGAAKANNKNDKQRAASSSASSSAAVSSNDNVWVNTPHGRLALSPQTYVGAALRVVGGGSEFAVPLFDAIPPPKHTTPAGAKLTASTSTTTATTDHAIVIAASRKRKAQALERCQTWHRQCVQQFHDAATRLHLHQNGSSLSRSSPSSATVRVLAPVVLDPAHRPAPPSPTENGVSSRDGENDDDDDDENDDLLFRQLRGQCADDSDDAEFSGSVLIGWHALDSVQRQHVVQRWHEHRRRHHGVPAVAPAMTDHNVDGNGFQTNGQGGAAAALVVLKTKSLEQFFDAALLLENGGRDRSQVLIACDLPAVWSRNHKAFVLRLPSPSRPSQGDLNHPPVTASSSAPEKTHTEPVMDDHDVPNPKRPRVDPNTKADIGANGGNKEHGWLDENGCVNLSPHCNGDEDVSRHPWFRDASPIVRGCRCATCRHHTRAYIYHLVCAKELLGEVLLFVHNLHHMLALVDRINAGGSGGGSDLVKVTKYANNKVRP